MSNTQVPTTKLQPTKSTEADPAAAASAQNQPAKSPNTLEEDDEFEDFPVEDWTQEEAEAATTGADGQGGTTAHLWEESWDDDDEGEEFAKQLREELKKVDGVKS